MIAIALVGLLGGLAFVGLGLGLGCGLRLGGRVGIQNVQDALELDWVAPLWFPSSTSKREVSVVDFNGIASLSHGNFDWALLDGQQGGDSVGRGHTNGIPFWGRCTRQASHKWRTELAMGQNPVPPVNISIPTEID